MPSQNHTIQNVTVNPLRNVGCNSFDLFNIDANTNITASRIHYTSVVGSQRLNQNSVNCVSGIFSNITLNVPAGQASTFVNPGDTDLTNAVSEGNSGFADPSNFLGWSWAEVAGELNGL